MTWNCPDCRRVFKNTNQWHSCLRKEPDDHFIGKEVGVRHVCEKILSVIKKWSGVQVSSVKNGIMVSAGSTFVALKPKNRWVDIEFVLDEPVDEFPVHKTVKVSKNRFAHFIRIGEATEVDKQLVDWLHRAYKTTSGK